MTKAAIAILAMTLMCSCVDDPDFGPIEAPIIEYTTTISDIGEATEGDTVYISFSLPQGGGSATGSYLVPREKHGVCFEPLEYIQIDTILEVLPVNERYGAKGLESEFRSVFEWVAEVVLLDSGIQLILTDHGVQESEARHLSSENVTIGLNGVGDIELYHVDLMDRCTADALAFANNKYDDQILGEVGDIGWSIMIDVDDNVYIDDDPRLREGVAYSLSWVLLHDLLHLFGLPHSGGIMHEAVPYGVSLKDRFANRLLDQEGIRDQLKESLGY